jgi:hypothetical protein
MLKRTLDIFCGNLFNVPYLFLKEYLQIHRGRFFSVDIINVRNSVYYCSTILSKTTYGILPPEILS